MMWEVVVPSALPELLNGVRTALALSFILLVSSELIVARQGLGNLIGYLGANGSYEAMFAVVLTVAFIGFLADPVYQSVVERALGWLELLTPCASLPRVRPALIRSSCCSQPWRALRAEAPVR